jgi:class 3 adenylate cyclase
LQNYPESFDRTFSSALDRALEGVLGRAARVTSFYVDPKMSIKSPDVYVELLKKIFSPELVSALVSAIGLELSKSFGFQIQREMNWRLSEYVSYAREPLQLRIEPQSGSVLSVGSDKEVRITLSNRTVGEMLVKSCDLQLSPELSLVEPSQPALDSQGFQLHPGESRTLDARVQGGQVGQARLSARAVIVDLRGRSKTIEVPLALYVVEREGRVTTGSSIVDGLLLGGLPRRSAVLLTSVPCDEKDNIVQGFLAVAPEATAYVSSDVDRSMQLHKLHPDLRLVVCSPQADLMPRASSIQVSRSLDNVSEIDDLLTHALETIPNESPRVFIQLISDILLLHKEVTTRHWLADLLPRLRARQCTVLAELNSGMHGAREMNALFDLFDGRLEIVQDEEIGQPVRFLRVVSLRGRKYLPNQATLTSTATGTSLEESRSILSPGASSSPEYEQLPGERRLAAIMFTDMVGYTALAQSNEDRALAVLNNHNQLVRPIFPRFNGREIKAMGDSFMVAFDSALDATNCAIEIQRLLHDYNSSIRAEWRISLRIGVHLGDVVHSRGDVLGDAVNVASRIQPLAEPEGVCVSQQVYDQVRNKVAYQFTRLETRDLKNVQFPVDIYKIVLR